MPPEILDLIFRLLEPADLVTCIRVNRLWHSVGVPVLWRGPYRSRSAREQGPSRLQRLHALSADPKRLQHYIPHIRALLIGRLDAEIVTRAAFIHQGKLWALLQPRVVKIDGLARSPLTLPIYKPALKALDYTAWVLSQAEASQLISLLARACPELEYLKIVARGQHIPHKAKHDISLELRDIKVFVYDITSVWDEAHQYSGSLIGEIFQHTKLQQLKLVGKELPAGLHAVTFDHPLIYVNITIYHTKPLRNVLLRLKKLRSLRIVVSHATKGERQDVKRDLIVPIEASRLRLEHLTILNSDSRMNLDEECMSILAQSDIALKSLRIDCFYQEPSEEIGSSSVVSIARANPSLITLQLGEQFLVTAETLIQVGQFCPEISHVTVNTTIDLIQICDLLEDGSGNLTRLQYLHAYRWDYHGRPFLSLEHEQRQGRETALARRCKRLMPSLLELSNDGPDDNDYEDWGDLCNTEPVINKFIQTGVADEAEDIDFYRVEDHSLDLQTEFERDLDKSVFASFF